jgi:hypothetical protein
MLPAREASAPFGIRMATAGMCSNESGIERRSTFMVIDDRKSIADPGPPQKAKRPTRWEPVRAFQCA